MKKYIIVLILAISCSKNSSRSLSDNLSGYWVELSHDKKLTSWTGHFHFTSNDNRCVFYDNVNHATFEQRHDNPINASYSLVGNQITFFYGVSTDTMDNGTIDFIGNDTIKLTGKPDISDPSHIPTVYWLRTDD